MYNNIYRHNIHRFQAIIYTYIYAQERLMLSADPVPSGGWRLRRMCHCQAFATACHCQTPSTRQSICQTSSTCQSLGQASKERSPCNVRSFQGSAKGFSYRIQTVRFRPRDGSVFVRFWPVSARRAAVFPGFEGFVWGFVFGAAQVCFLVLWLRSVAWPSSAKAFAQGFCYRFATGRFRPQDGSVFGPFWGRFGPLCRCVSPS